MNETQFHKELPLSSFQGVFACDELRPPLKLPASYIVNTDPRSKPGKHWTAIYIDKNGCGEYFDSFGLKPNKHILAFLKRVCKKAIYNTKRLQHNKSISCGVYCIYFLRRRHNMASLPQIFASFSTDNKIDNEFKLINYFNKSF